MCINVCTHIHIFYHMKTSVANFLISCFIMRCGLENIKCFIFQKFILEAHFYNDLFSFVENESTVSDGSDVYEQTGVENRKPISLQYFIPVHFQSVFLGNGFCVPFDYIKESILKCYSQICAPLARNRAPKMLTGEDTDFYFFLLYLTAQQHLS